MENGKRKKKISIAQAFYTVNIKDYKVTECELKRKKKTQTLSVDDMITATLKSYKCSST